MGNNGESNKEVGQDREGLMPGMENVPNGEEDAKKFTGIASLCCCNRGCSKVVWVVGDLRKMRDLAVASLVLLVVASSSLSWRNDRSCGTTCLFACVEDSVRFSSISKEMSRVAPLFAALARP